MHPLVLVVVPTHGHFQYAKRCIESLLASKRKLPGVVDYLLVDDGSQEWHSLDWAEWPDPDCQKIRFEFQGGLTRSLNAGLRYAADRGYWYTVCANSDVVFSQGWFQPMATAIDLGFSLVGPVTNAPGHASWQNVKPFCTNASHFIPLDDCQVNVDAIACAVRDLSLGPIEAPLNGFFLMAKTDTWWAGALNHEEVFNTQYPLEYNEVELQRRWNAMGLRTAFVAQSYIFHYRSVPRPEGLRGALGTGAFRSLRFR